MIEQYALIVGAMKSGTTSLFRHLSQHPEVCPCKKKEPAFFTDDEKWEKGLAWYEKLWKWKPGVHTVALEATTHYTKIPNFANAAERIASSGVKAKFIYLMRDPLSQIESHYTHGLSVGWLETPQGEEVDEFSIQVLMYAKQISQYYQRFPEEDILLLRFEDMTAHTEEVLQKVCRFLGIDPTFEFKNLSHVYNAIRRRAIEDHPAYNWWVKLPVLPKLGDRTIPEHYRSFIRSLIGKRPKENYKLTKEQRRYVLRRLSDDMHCLRDRYGVDLSGWNLEG